jgi:Holliday junction DNA helicase RuvA
VIGSLRGIVLDRSVDGQVLVEVAGVGYRVSVTPRTLAELEPTTTVFLHVYHHMREDHQALYGFRSGEERALFEALLKANGVGPALALNILATHQPAALRDIVATADVASLCLVPGVGKKTAERLVLELKSRLAVPHLDLVGAGGPGGAPSVLADVREALAGLGYSAEEIRDALREVSPAGDAATILREALGVLGARRA